jgi:hypothetical protein
MERETRLELALHLFEKSNYFLSQGRLLYRFLYRFRRFGNLVPYSTPPVPQESNLIPLIYLDMYP